MTGFIGKKILQEVLAEIEAELAQEDLSSEERAILLHQKAAILCQLGESKKQTEALQLAQRLAPDNEMISASLAACSI